MILLGDIRAVLVVSSQTLKIVVNLYRLIIRGIVRGAGHRGALKDCGKSRFIFVLSWGHPLVLLSGG